VNSFGLRAYQVWDAIHYFWAVLAFHFHHVPLRLLAVPIEHVLMPSMIITLSYRWFCLGPFGPPLAASNRVTSLTLDSAHPWIQLKDKAVVNSRSSCSRRLGGMSYVEVHGFGCSPAVAYHGTLPFSLILVLEIFNNAGAPFPFFRWISPSHFSPTHHILQHSLQQRWTSKLRRSQ